MAHELTAQQISFPGEDRFYFAYLVQSPNHLSPFPGIAAIPQAVLQLLLQQQGQETAEYAAPDGLIALVVNRPRFGATDISW